MKSKISIIVCTYDRADILDKCLKSLVNQKESINNYQLIIVDNGNNKDTKIVSDKYTSQHKNMSYIQERKVGLSNARNKGYKSAKYSWVAYIDDDAIADKDWVEQIIKFISKNKKVQVFGGPYRRYSLKPIPKWFPPEFGNKNLGNKVREIYPPQQWLSGGNFIVKKTLLEKLGGFSERFGMSGKKIRYGEEVSLQQKMINLNIPIYYSPHIRIKHIIRDEKMSLIWLLKNSFYHGLNAYEIKQQRHTIRSHAGALLRAIKKLFYWMFTSDTYPIKRKMYYALKPMISELGAIISIFKVH